MKTRILFLSYQSSRNGASRALYHFVKSLDTGRFESHIVFNRNGVIVPEYARFTGTTVLQTIKVPARGFLRDVRRRVLRKIHRRTLNRLLSSFRPHLIYVNTISHSEAAEWALEINDIPVVIHCREIDGTVMINYSPDWMDRMVARADLFLGCAQAVSDFLERCLGVERDRMITFRSSINFEEFQNGLVKPPGAIRLALGVPANALIVGGVGYPNFRKGVDLFVEAAAAVHAARPDLDIHFIWVGGSNELHDEPYMHAMRRLVKLRGLDVRFHWVREVPNPVSYVQAMTVQVSTAREEPLGLSIVEAMYIGTPVIAFAVGGIPELLSEGRGILVDRVAAGPMADTILRFVQNLERREDYARLARAEILAHYDIRKNSPALMDALETLARRGRNGRSAVHNEAQISPTSKS